MTSSTLNLDSGETGPSEQTLHDPLDGSSNGEHAKSKHGTNRPKAVPFLAAVSRTPNSPEQGPLENLTGYSPMPRTGAHAA